MNEVQYDGSKLRTTLSGAEGRRAFVYDDHTGKNIGRGSTIVGTVTIGIGRNVSSSGLSDAEMDYLLTSDIDQCVKDLTGIFQNFSLFGDVRQRALLEMRFNLGAGGFRSFNTFIGFVENEDWLRSSLCIYRSAWIKELPQRVERIMTMIQDGESYRD